MAQPPTQATYLAECFWPDVRQELVESAARRIRESAAELTRRGAGVKLTEAILLPGDEVVFYLFTGDLAAVRVACEHAGVRFERVIESVRC